MKIEFIPHENDNLIVLSNMHWVYSLYVMTLMYSANIFVNADQLMPKKTNTSWPWIIISRCYANMLDQRFAAPLYMQYASYIWITGKVWNKGDMNGMALNDQRKLLYFK